MGREGAENEPSLVARGDMVCRLSTALRRGGGALRTVPGQLKEILSTGSWRRFVTPRGELVIYADFERFVQVEPTKGLGGTVPILRRLVADDPETLDLLDRALQRPHGGDRTSAESKVNNINLALRPTGTRADTALRRLRKDRPDLHAKVIKRELSPHGAMVEAGFRTKTIAVPLDVRRAAAALRRAFSAAQLQKLRALLA